MKKASGASCYLHQSFCTWIWLPDQTRFLHALAVQLIRIHEISTTTEKLKIYLVPIFQSMHSCLAIQVEDIGVEWFCSFLYSLYLNFFYLEKSRLLHSPIFSEKYQQRYLIIKIPHGLLIIFHSNLQKGGWRTGSYALEQNHRQKSPCRSSRLQLPDLISN